MIVRVQTRDFDVGEELEELYARHAGAPSPSFPFPEGEGGEAAIRTSLSCGPRLGPIGEPSALRACPEGLGAVASFVGVVRDMNDGDAVAAMTLEHYPAMTEKALREIAGEAIERWRLVDAVVIHRVGTLQPCDQVVLVIAASAHRGDAFRACEFMIDTLKTRAPFWKRERTPAGERWVTARESDAQAATHWHADG